MKKVSSVLFDFWDTVIPDERKLPYGEFQILYDNLREKDKVPFERFCNELGTYFSRYYEDSNYEITFKAQLNFLSDYYGYHFLITPEEFEKKTPEIYSGRTVPGLKEFVLYLQSRNIPFRILSNVSYTADCENLLIDAAWKENPFPPVIASSDYGVEKPDSRFFLLGCKLSGFQPEETLYIGDDYKRDVIGSKKAGLLPCLLNWKNQHFTEDDEKDYQDYLLVSSYNELISRMKENDHDGK